MARFGEKPDTVPDADITDNTYLKDVIGNKEDAASKTADTTSIVALLRYINDHPWMFKYQAIAELDQDPPVADTYYTILDTTEKVRLLSIICRQINDEAGAKNLQLKVTIDGVTIEGTAAAFADNTWYAWFPTQTSEDWDKITYSGTGMEDHAELKLEAHSIKIEVRQTTAVGTNQKLDGRVRYEVLTQT